MKEGSAQVRIKTDGAWIKEAFLLGRSQWLRLMVHLPLSLENESLVGLACKWRLWRLKGLAWAYNLGFRLLLSSWTQYSSSIT